MAYLADSFDNEIIVRLQNGGVGVLPTDTIYGLSCQALDKQAVERIYELKGRNSKKPVVVLISDLNMLDLLSIDKASAEVIKKFWPGKLSAIFEAPNAPAWLTRGAGSLAVRWPDYPELCKLIDESGPLVSTSANPEGKTPANSIETTRHYFGESVDFYVDTGPLNGLPSTIVEIKPGQLEVIRQGVLKLPF